MNNFGEATVQVGAFIGGLDAENLGDIRRLFSRFFRENPPITGTDKDVCIGACWIVSGSLWQSGPRTSHLTCRISRDEDITVSDYFEIREFVGIEYSERVRWMGDRLIKALSLGAMRAQKKGIAIRSDLFTDSLKLKLEDLYVNQTGSIDGSQMKSENQLKQFKQILDSANRAPSDNLSS